MSLNTVRQWAKRRVFESKGWKLRLVLRAELLPSVEISLRAQLGCKGDQARVDFPRRLVHGAVARIDRDAPHVDAAPLRARLVRVGVGVGVGVGVS